MQKETTTKSFQKVKASFHKSWIIQKILNFKIRYYKTRKIAKFSKNVICFVQIKVKKL